MHGAIRMTIAERIKIGITQDKQAELTGILQITGGRGEDNYQSAWKSAAGNSNDSTRTVTSEVVETKEKVELE